MVLNKDNIEVFAAKFYTNKYCQTKDEFLSDLGRVKLACKLARKVNNSRSQNMRLLLNHVICFTNNFELSAAKQLVLFVATDKEKPVFKTMLTYLNLLDRNEWTDIPHSLETAKLLKDLDR